MSMNADTPDYRRDLLYRLLPQVYRSRDNGGDAEAGDMQAFLRVFGAVLNRFDATLDQRLADAFPDAPPPSRARESLACQAWVSPYFADLLDVSLASPHADGRRTEVAKAVAWRQRKGALGCLEDIARSVAGMEMVVREGWRLVARTPWIDGHDAEWPARTVNLFQKSCALPADNAAGYAVRNPAGAPCAPGSYADRSTRTADLRNAGGARGQTHPGRVLLYFPPPAGFFPADGPALDWADRETAREDGLIDWEEAPGLLRIRGRLKVPLRLENLSLPGGPLRLELEGLTLSDALVLPAGSRLQAGRCAFRVVVVKGGRDEERPEAVEAVDCLFGVLRAAQGLRLEYCTVLGFCATTLIRASDCLFRETIGTPAGGCVRYSRLQTEPDAEVSLEAGSCTCDPPRFFSTVFGQPGCGVLHPQTPKAIRFGAEDRGEMGAYHHQCIALALEAVLDKTRDYLPAGLEPALIPDPALAARPEATETLSQD